MARWKGAVVLQSLLLAVGLSASAGAETTATVSLAEVDGDSITGELLEQALGARLRQLEEQVYDLKRKQLDALIAERLLAQEAARRGTSVVVLLDAEVTAKVGLVTEQEVEAFLAPGGVRAGDRRGACARGRCADGERRGQTQAIGGFVLRDSAPDVDALAPRQVPAVVPGPGPPGPMATWPRLAFAAGCIWRYHGAGSDAGPSGR
jgi:hypothetical protein